MLKPFRLTFVRNIAMVPRGLKKDPASYMVSPNGTKYPPPASVLEPVHKFLGTDYPLSEHLILQSVTHKSFAHGKTPYNEKLAIMGNQLLRLEASRAVVDSTGCDVHSNVLDLPASSFTTSQICKKANLDGALFWKAANGSPKTEATIGAGAVNALIGAILAEHGLAKAQQFIRDRLLQGEYSVFHISASVYVKKD